MLVITTIAAALILARFGVLSSRQRLTVQPRRRRGLPAFALAAALALTSLAGGTAWASAPAPAAGQAQPNVASATASTTINEGSRSLVQNYAEREAAAKGLEKFEGGASTVVIGSSTLVIILVVVLILILI